MKRLIFLCFLIGLLLSCRGIFAQGITVTSPPAGTTLTYTVALLSGTLDDRDATEIQLQNPRIHKKQDEFVVGQAYQGRFKILAPLRQGENTLVLRCGEVETKFKLRYRRNNNPYTVRVVYMTGSDGISEMQTHHPDDSTNVKGKLRTAMLLMQTMTAERMNDLGYGRRTFNLQLDENDEVIVNVMQGDKTTEEYRQMDGGELWGSANHLIGQHYNFDVARYLVIPAFSKKDPETGKDLAHTALGGGSTGLFGGGTLYAWPDSIEKAYYSMIDARRIDTSRVKDDSVGRNTYWANGATCIGASLHELGHTFGLPHSTYPTDIMTRGHDHFYRVFLLREAPSAHNGNWWEIDPKSAAEFAPPSATMLIVTRWFANDDPRKWPKGAIEFNDDPAREAVFVRAANGIACIQAHEDGDIKFHMAPEPEKAIRRQFPKTARVPYEKIREKLKGDTAVIRIYDAYGHSYEHGDQTIRLNP